MDSTGNGTYNIDEYFEDTHSNTTWNFQPQRWRWNVAVSLCLAVVGIAANVALLLVILLIPRLRTTSNILVVNLAIADIMMFVFSVPMSTMMWMFVSFPEGTAGIIICKLMGGAWVLSQVLCATSLTAVSIERFCTLKWRIQMKRTVAILVTVWMVGLCFTVPLWVFVTLDVYTGSDGGSLYFCRLLPPNRLAIAAFSTSYTILTYVLPVLIIIICYVGMAQVLVCRKSSGESVEAIRARRRLAVVVLVLAVAFIVFWFPYHFINMFFLYASVNTLVSLPFEFYLRLMEIAHVLIYVNSCLNPFVVFLISGVHRKPLHDFLCCRKRCGRQTATRKVDGRYAPVPDGVYTETVFSTNMVGDRE
ncbi:neuromedin-B receptor-like [Asterias amurensis]|uniref:neuromedin-B receptor-like n=1 Tax=Asterias amurensis TaxID=7602 RepID=UPI003AB3BD26